MLKGGNYDLQPNYNWVIAFLQYRLITCDWFVSVSPASALGSPASVFKGKVIL
ncbi:MAG: hypothetical protein FJ044_05290 [Candidatus Cloacimonetes bacterium]|nr:hypothetical protein [Candidatus Cloacimonadota bacterium]